MIISSINLGENLKSLRKLANITQEQLSNLTKIDQNSISRIENGQRSCNVSTIQRIVQAIQKNNPEIPEITLAFSNTKVKNKKST
jgi:transcriptional regulator with XRE-family HTH domain